MINFFPLKKVWLHSPDYRLLAIGSNNKIGFRCQVSGKAGKKIKELRNSGI